LGDHLIKVHDWFREDLARLREGLGSEGGEQPVAGRVPRPLQVQCLMSCSALHAHHSTEDNAVFMPLARQCPELRPALEELERDHRVVAGMLDRIEALAVELGGAVTPERAGVLCGELDGLAAVLETHFRYEERQLVDVLNGLSARS
jgi:hypothetical protein